MYQKLYYVNLAKAYLPTGAELIVSNKANQQRLVYALDLDGDGAIEVIAAYRLQEEIFLTVIKCHGGYWYVADRIKGKGYNVSYLKVAPITNRNANDIVVGWQVGGVWSELSIYSWNHNKLQDIVQENVYFSNIEVNAFSDNKLQCSTYKIAFWKHDTGDAYQVEIWRWQDGKLILAREANPQYFKKVVRYYSVLTKEFPDSPVYWYYLADAQYKAGLAEGALQSIDIAISFPEPYPGREVLLALRKKIIGQTVACSEVVDIPVSVKPTKPKPTKPTYPMKYTKLDIENATDIFPTNECAAEKADDVVGDDDNGQKRPNLFPASLRTTKGQKWGYINDLGEFVIEPVYDYAMDFQKNGLAVVEAKSNQSGIINQQGKYVVQPQYSMITEFSEGRATVVDDKGYWMIDESGTILTKKAYNYIATMKENRALFTDVDAEGNYLYGYMDRQGQEVIPMQYRGGTEFNKGKAVVQLNENESALIEPDGKTLQKYPYGNVGALNNGLMTFQSKPGEKFGYINEQGKTIIEPKYTWAQGFYEGRAIVNIADNYINETGLIDETGKYIVEPRYNTIINLKKGRYGLGKAINPQQPYLGSNFSIADKDGKRLTEYIYHQVTEYKNDLASVEDGKSTFFIGLDGERVKDLPRIAGSGMLTMMGNGNVIKANVDMRIYYLSPDGKIIWQQNKIIPLNETYKVIEKKYKPNKDYLVYYPVVDGMEKHALQQHVNKKLRELSLVKAIDMDEQLDYSYTGDFSVEFFKKQLLVLELTGYNFPFGAAHGMPTKIYPHIDIVTGRFYELKDLFKPKSNYAKVLSDIVGEQIKTDPQYSYVFPDAYKGIAPDQPFYVSKEALFLYFAPYEIGPYAAGFPTFKIPFAQFSDIINKKGSFWKAFHYER